MERAASGSLRRPALGAILQFDRASIVGHPVFLLVPIPLGVSHLGSNYLGPSQGRLAPTARRTRRLQNLNGGQYELDRDYRLRAPIRFRDDSWLPSRQLAPRVS